MPIGKPIFVEITFDADFVTPIDIYYLLMVLLFTLLVHSRYVL